MGREWKNRVEVDQGDAYVVALRATGMGYPQIVAPMVEDRRMSKIRASEVV